METMLLVVKELLPMVLAAAVAGGICYFQGFSHGMEKAMEEGDPECNESVHRDKFRSNEKTLWRGGRK